MLQLLYNWQLLLPQRPKLALAFTHTNHARASACIHMPSCTAVTMLNISLAFTPF